MHRSSLIFTLVLVSTAFAAFAKAYPQTQLKWNWEEVILSRNGPSTTTTPRPTRWSTTTLRFLEGEPIVGSGSGSVEDAYIVPRARSDRPLASKGSITGPTTFTVLTLAILCLRSLWPSIMRTICDTIVMYYLNDSDDDMCNLLIWRDRLIKIRLLSKKCAWMPTIIMSGR